jgi:hypothetical protein
MTPRFSRHNILFPRSEKHILTTLAKLTIQAQELAFTIELLLAGEFKWQ